MTHKGTLSKAKNKWFECVQNDSGHIFLFGDSLDASCILSFCVSFVMRGYLLQKENEG